MRCHVALEDAYQSGFVDGQYKGVGPFSLTYLYWVAMRLADFITANLEQILDEWEAYARHIRAAQDLDSTELRDHARQMLEAIAKDLATPQTAEEQKEKSRGHRDSKGSASVNHGAGRAKVGFSIEDMISEYRALRASVLRLWGKETDSVQQCTLDDMTRFNEAIDQAMAEAVARYSSIVKQAQDLFLGILGHDLRNPLGAISMSAQFLMQDANLDSRYIKSASIIYNSSNQMRRLIDDLLSFARTRLGQSMPVSLHQTDLARIVNQAVMQARAFHPDCTIVFDVTGDLHGQWDSTRIEQVFSNLIGNAIAHGDNHKPVSVTLAGNEQEVIATVHNSGKPIPESDLPHIFEPLRQSADSSSGKHQQSSLGLGLYIAREIIHAHSGAVTVASSSETGTTFTVQLPRHRLSA